MDARKRRKLPVRKTTVCTNCPKCGTWFSHTIRSDKYTARWTHCRCGAELVWPQPKERVRG